MSSRRSWFCWSPGTNQGPCVTLLQDFWEPRNEFVCLLALHVVLCFLWIENFPYEFEREKVIMNFIRNFYPRSCPQNHLSTKDHVQGPSWGIWSCLTWLDFLSKVKATYQKKHIQFFQEKKQKFSYQYYDFLNESKLTKWEAENLSMYVNNWVGSSSSWLFLQRCGKLKNQPSYKRTGRRKRTKHWSRYVYLTVIEK